MPWKEVVRSKSDERDKVDGTGVTGWSRSASRHEAWVRITNHNNFVNIGIYLAFAVLFCLAISLHFGLGTFVALGVFATPHSGYKEFDTMRSWKLNLASVALMHVILIGATTLTAATPDKKRHQHTVNPNPPSAIILIAAGKKVYRSLDCSTCHILNNKGTPGVGPDLTHVGKTWAPDKLKAMIRNPRAVQPKGFMTAYDKTKINTTQMKALVAYLASLQ